MDDDERHREEISRHITHIRDDLTRDHWHGQQIRDDLTSDHDKLTPELRDLALDDLETSTAYHLEVIQGMMDGVTLAAEQVQDKRLEFLEAGPSADPGAAVLLFVVTLILEGSVAPAIAGSFTALALRPLFRRTVRARRAVLNDARRREYKARFHASRMRARADLRRTSHDERLAREAEHAANLLSADRKRKKNEVLAIRQALADAIEFGKTQLVAVAQASLTLNRTPKANIGAEASPGVEIRGAAMASASDLRLLVRLLESCAKTYLRRPDITVGETKELLDAYRTTEVDIAYIREAFQEATEVLIWSQLLLDNFMIDIAQDRAARTDPATAASLPEHVRASRPRGERLMIPENHPLTIRNMKDPRLKDYLSRRFAKELVRWINDTGAYVPLWNMYSKAGGAGFLDRPKGVVDEKWWQDLPEGTREDFIVQYLVHVHQNTLELRLWQ